MRLRRFRDSVTASLRRSRHSRSRHPLLYGDAATRRPRALPLPDIPSIAVLPFVNLSVDADQEYFADGVTEDIITQMSRFKSLFVIARNSSFSYRNKAVDIRQIGRELGVRYVVEGSIRRSNNRVRLTARLVDSLSATHIWADTYDRVLEDIFAVQEEVTECIAAAIAPNIDEAEMLRARSRPQQCQCLRDGRYVPGRSHGASGKTRTPRRGSKLGACAVCPAHRSGQRDCARCDRQCAVSSGQSSNRRRSRIRVARRHCGGGSRYLGCACQFESCRGRRCCCFTASERRRWDEALVEARMAYQLNPQDSFAVMVCGHVIGLLGEPAEAIRLLERGLRINPRDPAAYNTYTGLALCHLLTKEYRKGVEWAMRATAAAPGNCLAQLSLAALLVGLDELGQARAALEVARRLAPAYVQSRLDGHATIREGEYRQRFTTFIRIAAGLEDPDTAKPLR